jgi:hypothetical protein
MLLAGHHHVQSAHSARDLATRAGGALVIQAGTATSVRLREGTQSFNRIDINGDMVELTVQKWAEGKFVSDTAQRFERRDENWKLVGAEKDIPAPAH